MSLCPTSKNNSTFLVPEKNLSSKQRCSRAMRLVIQVENFISHKCSKGTSVDNVNSSFLSRYAKRTYRRFALMITF